MRYRVLILALAVLLSIPLSVYATESMSSSEAVEVINEEEPVNSGSIPSDWEDGTNLEDNVRMIRLYLEFTIFMVFPLVVAVFSIFLGCRWFGKTFVRF